MFKVLMSVENNLFNFAIIGSSFALLSWLLLRLRQSKKPIRRYPPEGGPVVHNDGTIDNVYSDDEYNEADGALQKQYDKEWNVYFIVYWLPPLLAMAPLVSIINIDIGMIFLVITVVYWVVTEFAIKLYNIGV